MIAFTPDELTLLIVLGGVLVGIVAAFALVHNIRDVRAKDCWEKVAWALQLEFQDAGPPLTWRLRGKLSGFPVIVKVIPATAADAGTGKKAKQKKQKKRKEIVVGRTRIEVVIPSDFPSTISLRRRGKRAVRAGLSSGVLTGDAKFDRHIDARGDATALLAILNARTRLKLLNVVGSVGASVERGKVTWDYHGLVHDRRKLVTMIKAIVSLASGLKGTGESPEHSLLLNVMRDKDREVKNVSFSTLMTRYIYKPETHRAAVSMLGGTDPITEMLAGMHAGEAGIERVKGSAMDPKLPPSMRVRCIEHLIREHPQRTGTMVVEMIGPILESLAEKELSRLIGLLALMEPEVAQFALLPFLALPIMNIQVGALVTLGDLGKDDVVAHLQQMVDERYTDSKVKTVARKAIASIRTRVLNIAQT